MSSMTQRLATRVAELNRFPLPADVRHQTERSLLNVIATAIGASGQPAVQIVVGVGRSLGGRPVATVPGLSERLDLHHAALATGVAAHLDDYDDTHLKTVIHPGAACLGGGLGLARREESSGGEFLTAFALGIEVQLRVGAAMSPVHYDEGWHITGTVGPIGAAVTAGLLLRLPADQLATAIAIAATMALGHRESFGTMEKAYHPGRAAANGLTAALLAQSGFPIRSDILEGPGGYYELLSAEHRPEQALEDLGERWELLDNTYKPYPCGIVCHPAIDAAVALHSRIGDPSRIRSASVHCHPLVTELTGNANPTDGLEARFSTIHGVAVGLADGRGGLPEYSDERVVQPDLIRLRGLIQLRPDPEVPRAAATVEVELEGGERLSQHVAHARGSLERPLTDAELSEKATGLIDPVLPCRTGEIEAAVGALAAASDLNRLETAIAAGGAA